VCCPVVLTLSPLLYHNPEFSTLQISRMYSEEKLPQAWWEEEIAVDATIQIPIE
jgi:hypothetical protein